MNESLIAANIYVVNQAVNHYRRRIPQAAQGVIDSEELHSIGELALVEASERYDATRGLPFGAFAYIRVRGAMLDAIRKATGRGANQAPPMDSLERPMLGDDLVLGDTVRGRSDTELKAEVDALIERALALPERPKHVILRKLLGFTDREIGDQLGLTEGSVSQRVWQARDLLRKSAA
jgi:RNA polymerase sigma factor (sigma-70 family)